MAIGRLHSQYKKALQNHASEASIPFIDLIFYYLSRLYTTHSNSCKLLQLVNYATCFGLSATIRLTHKYGSIKV